MAVHQTLLPRATHGGPRLSAVETEFQQRVSKRYASMRQACCWENAAAPVVASAVENQRNSVSPERRRSPLAAGTRVSEASLRPRFARICRYLAAFTRRTGIHVQHSSSFGASVVAALRLGFIRGFVSSFYGDLPCAVLHSPVACSSLLASRLQPAAITCLAATPTHLVISPMPPRRLWRPTT